MNATAIARFLVAIRSRRALPHRSGGTVTIDSTSSVKDNSPNNCLGTTACGA
jgi:hypothetical protein